MQFKNSFTIPLPLREAWTLILDIPTVLPCLPGAQLKGVEGDAKYEGVVQVKLGPVKLSFEGEAEIIEKDLENYIVYMRGSGTDPKGRGSAESTFSFQLSEVSDTQTDVVVTTNLALSGAVAQYGRGSGMISEVAAQILKNFEMNLARLVEGGHHLQDDKQADTLIGYDAAALSDSTLGRNEVNSGDSSLADEKRVMTNIGFPDVNAAQAQIVLAQAQTVLAQTQALLLKSGLLGPGKRKEFKAAELNMFKIGLSAFWARIKHMFSKS